MSRDQKCRLESLPAEIILNIISYLDGRIPESALVRSPPSVSQRKQHTLRDVSAMSLCSWKLRNLALARLFRRISVSWRGLDLIISKFAVCHFLEHVEIIDVHPADSWGEWHQGTKLSQLIDMCPRVHALFFEVAGSSHWLRYVGGSDRITTIIAMNAAVLSGKEYSTTQAQAFFDMGHVAQFKNLSVLTLQGFNVTNSAIEDIPTEEAKAPKLASPMLSRLTLWDCSWDWPWDVSDFGTVSDLMVVYTDLYRSFTCELIDDAIDEYLLTQDSERLQEFAKAPPKTIERLRLYMLERSPLSRKAWLPLSKHECKNLKYLGLKGFEVPGSSFFDRLPASLERLELEIAVLKKNMHTKSFDVKQDVWSKLPRLTVAVECK